ncbi:MAG: sulfotransferase [Erythrobacter sp.]
MSTFNDSGSKWQRFAARNEGNLISGFAREAMGKALLRPQLRKLFRPFLKEKQPDKWLFVVGCYNSGTTILRRLLESHPEISAIVREGAKLTDAFPDLEVGGWPRMMFKNRHLWDLPQVGAAERAQLARKDWSFWFDSNASVFFEKSIDHTTRMEWLDRHFPNAHFIGIRRNGYCVNEGIMRRAKPSGEAAAQVGESYPAELCAKQWVAFDETLTQGSTAVQRSTNIRYEDLMEHPTEVMRELFDFLDLKQPDMRYDGDTLTIGEQSHQLLNQNDRSLARLAPDQIAQMKPIMQTTMLRHGYAIDLDN